LKEEPKGQMIHTEVPRKIQCMYEWWRKWAIYVITNVGKVWPLQAK